ncbi:hypothetical protein FAUST_1747 [Fusarium austroamericanum]|uniref:Uncharacterized protein n=1 Tax=Fusarium austroamericanum TaxID=282268 RepID=A0AAN6HJF1_FUSAU|nr:hypothetical protein FAUST_1747 [Fusarium austroamericanum]
MNAKSSVVKPAACHDTLLSVGLMDYHGKVTSQFDALSGILDELQLQFGDSVLVCTFVTVHDHLASSYTTPRRMYAPGGIVLVLAIICVSL